MANVGEHGNGLLHGFFKQFFNGSSLAKKCLIFCKNVAVWTLCKRNLLSRAEI